MKHTILDLLNHIRDQQRTRGNPGWWVPVETRGGKPFHRKTVEKAERLGLLFIASVGSDGVHYVRLTAKLEETT